MCSATDLLEAFQFGNQCVQDVSYFDILRFGDISEDCLFLNVWRPKPKEEKRAVMVSYEHFYFLEKY